MTQSPHDSLPFVEGAPPHSPAIRTAPSLSSSDERPFMQATGRRVALGSLAASALALAASRISGPAEVAAQDDVEAEKRGRRGKKGKKGRKGKRGNQGNQGPGGPAGPAGPAGPVQSTLVEGDVESLPGFPIGASAVSVATCGADSVLLGCGYELSTDGVGTTPDAALSNAIADVVPDTQNRRCTATLLRTDLISGTITAQAQIQAYAICRA